MKKPRLRLQKLGLKLMSVWIEGPYFFYDIRMKSTLSEQSVFGLQLANLVLVEFHINSSQKQGGCVVMSLITST